MASEEFKKEYGQHLVDQVLQGKMTRRQMLVRASVFGFSMTAAGSLLAACGGSSSSTSSPAASGSAAGPAPVLGGSLVGVIPPPIVSLDPVTIYDQGGIVLAQQVAEYLIALNNDNSLKPQLATKWEPNTDGSEWTFTLRQGVTFNDGSPLEAADVVASMDRVLNPKSGSGALSALSGILSPGGTTAVDTSTVKFTLDKPFADFPYLVCQSSYNTAILSRNYDGNFDKPTTAVGTGPFMLKSYTPKQQAVMVKNPNYWGKDAQGRQLPYLDQVTWTFVQDESAANLQLQSGAVDFQPQTVFQGSQALFADANLRVDIYPGSGIREVAFNLQKDPWKSAGKELRQAVAYCLDRKAINEALYAGRSNLGYDTFWEPTVFPGQPTPPERAQDYAKAKELLTTAGFPNGTTIELTVAKYLENPQLAQLIQQQCKGAGITVNINQISYDAFYAGTETNTPWLNAPMVIVEWGSRPTPGVYAQAMLMPGVPWSSSHWNNQEFASTFNSYMSTVDETKRTEYATKLSGIQQDDTPIMVPFFITQLRTQKKTVYGIQGPGNFYCIMSEAFKTA
jgi:peptide/nickel transport system substrate-binding protein